MNIEMNHRILLPTLIGRQFGCLTITDDFRDKKSYIAVKVRCACGKEWQGYFSNLKKGGTHSCGCLGEELKRQRKSIKEHYNDA